jgi:hypothetical protein
VPLLRVLECILFHLVCVLYCGCFDFMCFCSVCVCERESSVICVVLIFSVLRLCTYFYGFVVVLLFCVIFIFVCTSATE